VRSMRWLSVLGACCICSCSTGAGSSLMYGMGTSALGDRSKRASTSGHLYVMDGASISVYPPMSGSPTRIVTQDVKEEFAIAVDSTAHLYVANYSASSTEGNVVVYQPNSGKPLRVITNGIQYPESLGVDANDLLYVGTFDGLVFSAQGRHLLRTIDANGEPDAFTFGSDGRVYVTNFYSSTVTAYTAGGKRELFSISKHLKNPLATTLGPDGSLYVVDCGDACLGHRKGAESVNVYNAASGKLSYVIADGIASPAAVAVDSAGNLYVANVGPHRPGSVTVYAPGTKTVLRTIADGIDEPVSLAFDYSGDLYVSNEKSGTVTAYAPGGSTPTLTIRKGLKVPSYLIFGT
jgi:sugar lactone lactonase YvrE